MRKSQYTRATLEEDDYDIFRCRSLVIVRPAAVFGEGNRGNVYQLLRQIASRRFVMVGSGHNRKSMAYVGNVSALLCTPWGWEPAPTCSTTPTSRLLDAGA